MFRISIKVDKRVRSAYKNFQCFCLELLFALLSNKLDFHKKKGKTQRIIETDTKFIHEISPDPAMC